MHNADNAIRIVAMNDSEYSTAREYWTRYVASVGGVKATAERLGSPYQTIASITNGHRGIGRKLAQRFVRRDPDLDANTLIWVRALKEAA